MYRLAISLSFLFAPIATNIAMATEAEDFHRYYVSYFNGTWIFEQDGTETVITCNDKHTYNFCSGSGGQVNELWGYNPAQQAWGAYGRGGDLVWEWVMDSVEVFSTLPDLPNCHIIKKKHKKLLGKT